jgi:hypothetical protein
MASSPGALRSAHAWHIWLAERSHDDSSGGLSMITSHVPPSIGPMVVPGPHAHVKAALTAMKSDRSLPEVIERVPSTTKSTRGAAL